MKLQGKNHLNSFIATDAKQMHTVCELVHYHLQQMGFKQVYSRCEYWKQIDKGFFNDRFTIIRYKDDTNWMQVGHVQPCTCKHMNADVNMHQLSTFHFHSQVS